MLGGVLHGVFVMPTRFLSDDKDFYDKYQAALAAEAKPATRLSDDVAEARWLLTQAKLMLAETEWNEALHPRAADGRFGEKAGERETDTKPARTFSNEEGYEWHEQGPVLEWAMRVPHDLADAVNDYAGFSYGRINGYLRTGEEPTRTVDVRDATQPERRAIFDEMVRITDEEDRTGKAPYRAQDSPNLPRLQPGERWRISGASMKVVKDEPDQKEIADIHSHVDKVNAVIAKGYVLPEAITVGRGAYLPGVTFEQLRAMSGGGQEFMEKGFTSTSLGPAGGRTPGYAAAAKWESIYNRFGGGHLVEKQDEVGSAVNFNIVLPKGTKVASVEALRRLEYKFPKIPDPAPRPVDIDAEYWTKTDYSAKPTISTKRLSEKDSRSESEVLLGSGARFKVVSVEHGEPSRSSDGTLHDVPIVNVTMRYVGGGSSEGGK